MVSTVVKENVKLMISSEERGMQRFASTESMGGNAGVYQGKSCVGINFYFEPATGKIIEFTNEVNRTFSQGRFRIEMPVGKLDLKTYNPTEKKYPRILSYKIIPESGWGVHASAQAEAVIQKSMRLYNQCCDALEHTGIFKW